MEEVKTVEVSQRLFTLLAVVIIILGLFMLGQMVYQFKSLPQNIPQEVNVSGEGKAYAKPDVAMVNFGVHTEDLKSQDAVNKNNQVMNDIIKSIKEAGVEDKDIQTTLYNLDPLYDFTKNGRVFKGFSLDQQVRVKIRNFDKINDILDRAAANGANTTGDLRFDVDDMEKVRAEARAKAIDQAKEKAMSLFSQSGLQAEKLVNIYEDVFPMPPPIFGLGGPVAESRTVAPQIQTGQIEVTSKVILTYRAR